MPAPGALIEYRDYRCQANKTTGAKACANYHSVREDIARRGILESIRERLMSPDGELEMRTRVAAQLRDYSKKVDGELRDLRARLTRTEEKMAGLADFLAGGERSPYIVKTLQDHEVFADQDRQAIVAPEAEAHEPPSSRAFRRSRRR